MTNVCGVEASVRGRAGSCEIAVRERPVAGGVATATGQNARYESRRRCDQNAPCRKDDHRTVATLNGAEGKKGELKA
jgi:hypothetical protein